MRRRRNRYIPSSGHKLAELVKDLSHPLQPGRIKAHLERLERSGLEVSKLAGQAGSAWAIDQLSTSPFVVRGWPAPCKAARMRLGKARA